jgi:hypothetical protein
MATIEQFVRGTLGCGCPDEVFRTVSVNHVPTAASRGPFTELELGSRLLIRVVGMPDDPSAAGWLEELASDGRAARDRHGLHRFRLVLAARAGGATTVCQGALATRFARATAGDDRAHLHVLEQGQIPESLSAEVVTK